MIALLDPKIWLAIVLVLGISGGIGYWRGNTAGQAAVQAKWDKAKAAAIEAAAKAKDQDIDKGQHPVPSRKHKAQSMQSKSALCARRLCALLLVPALMMGCANRSTLSSVEYQPPPPPADLAALCADLLLIADG